MVTDGMRKLRLSGLGALALPLVVGLAWQPCAALAQSFTVHNGETAGPQALISVGDTGLIELGGTVNASGGAPGVIMLGADQTLDIFGSIVTVDAFGHGVYSQVAGATVNNAGSITTNGPIANGIYSIGADVAITNSGSILTTGPIGYGISSTGAGATITNSGSIETTGPIGYGIESQGAGAAIVNSGSIATTGSFGYGIFSSGLDATIINSGSISTTGSFGYGISSSGANATITNTGSIATTGSFGYGIYAAGADATVTNSGSIVAWEAIRFDQGNATLKLLSGTAIQGAVSFAGSGNTVSFGPGLNAVMTFSGAGVPATIETSGNPYAVSGNTVAVLDRTGLALTDEMALSLAGDIAGAVGRGPSACLAPDGTPSGETEDCATTAWFTGFGGYGGRDGNEGSVASAYGYGGALAGLEFSPGEGFTAGLFIGAAAGHGSAGTAQETALSGGVVGGYAGVARDGYFVDFYAALGLLGTESERTVANNSIDDGLYTASATEDGAFFNPAVTVGADLDTGNGILTPSLRLRYTALGLDGYADAGGGGGLAVDARTVHELEIRAQAAFALTPVVTEAGEVAWTLRAGADAIDRQGDVSAELLGQDITFASAAAGTLYRGFAGLDLDYALPSGSNLFGNLELRLDDQLGRSATAQVGVGGAF